jgi:hypothetical protein
MGWQERSAGLLLDPWRFDPAAAARAANDVLRAGAGAQALLQRWVGESRAAHEAMAAVLVARLVLHPVPPLGAADSFRPDAPPLPHHPFIVSDGLPFLPVGEFEAGGAGLAPIDAIAAVFGRGRLRTAPYDDSADPIRAVTDLLRSERWQATIVEHARPQASQRVRWQAVRALGRADLLAGLEPATADAAAFEAWWQDRVARCAAVFPAGTVGPGGSAPSSR